MPAECRVIAPYAYFCLDCWRIHYAATAIYRALEREAS